MKKNFLFLILICIAFQACDSGSKKTSVVSSTAVIKKDETNDSAHAEPTNETSKTATVIPSLIHQIKPTTNLPLNSEQQNIPDSNKCKSFKESVTADQLTPQLLENSKPYKTFVNGKNNRKDKIIAESDGKINKFGKEDEKSKDLTFQKKDLKVDHYKSSPNKKRINLNP